MKKRKIIKTKLNYHKRISYLYPSKDAVTFMTCTVTYPRYSILIVK